MGEIEGCRIREERARAFLRERGRQGNGCQGKRRGCHVFCFFLRVFCY